jgi:alpha-1,6-mannosyltransferase
MTSAITAKTRQASGIARQARTPATSPLALITLGIGSAGLYFWGRDLHRFTQWVAAFIFLFIGQLAFYAAACVTVFRWSGGATRLVRWLTLSAIVVFAVTFRAMLVPQRPYLSADVYRYVWDGYLETNGINPYRYAPSAPELSTLRDQAIYPNINGEDKRWLSPYPPVAQMVFWLVSHIRPMSVTGFKAAMSSLDILAVLLVMLVLARSGIDPARAILFAWHPLVIFEGAHSGHIEPVFIMFLMVGLLAWSSRKYALTGAMLAFATLTKFYPILALPAFLITERKPDSRRGAFALIADRRNLSMLAGFAATLALSYAPFIAAGRNVFGFLRGYVQEEGFVQSGSRYFFLDSVREIVPIPTGLFLIAALAFLIAIAVWQLTRSKRDALDVSRAAIAMIGTYLLLTTPRYAWYYVWLVPFLCFAPRLAWMYLACASALLYLVWYTPFEYPDVPLWLGAAIFVPALVMLVFGARHSVLALAGRVRRST